jgi:hypothetical protein
MGVREETRRALVRRRHAGRVIREIIRTENMGAL